MYCSTGKNTTEEVHEVSDRTEVDDVVYSCEESGDAST